MSDEDHENNDEEIKLNEAISLRSIFVVLSSVNNSISIHANSKHTDKVDQQIRDLKKEAEG